jgi:hypothetical protein
MLWPIESSGYAADMRKSKASLLLRSKAVFAIAARVRAPRPHGSSWLCQGIDEQWGETISDDWP